MVVSDAEGKRYLSTGTIKREVSDIDACPVEKPRTTSVQKIRGAYAMSVPRQLLEHFSFVINERIVRSLGRRSGDNLNDFLGNSCLTNPIHI